MTRSWMSLSCRGIHELAKEVISTIGLLVVLAVLLWWLTDIAKSKQPSNFKFRRITCAG